ncbi:uncharacterized protein [Nicotiana sylvestris]|uniref:uncharacterized protein n=1 Tax=Nicotiana sylvestris TaxID=4096 RepID=UPI00388C74E9
MVASWGETSDEDSEDEAEEEQALMAIGESDDEQEVLEHDNSVLELRSENLKLKLGIGKKKVDHTYLTLEENLGKMKDELYKKDELIKVLKEDLGKVKHELDRTCKWNKAYDALSWLQEHHSSNKRGLGYGTQAPKWDSRSKYLLFLKIKSAHTVARPTITKMNVQVKGRSQIWYMDSGCSKHMTGNKDQFLSLEDLKGGNDSFGNGKKGEIIGVVKVGKTDSHSIENDYLIDGLKYSLISVSQLCDRDHNFSAPRNPQQNGVVERKNRTLEDMARTMLLSSKLPHNFWAEAVNTACYIISRCMTRPLIEKTPYELLKGRKPNISHLRAFGCKCYVHNNRKDFLGKFDPRSDEGVFLGYYSHRKAYKVFNKRTLCVEESVHVVFDETNILSERQEHEDKAIGLVKELTKSPVQVKVASKEGTGDGTCPSNQGNLTGGTNQGEIESNPLEELVHEPVPLQQNMGEISSRNQLVVKPHKYQSSHPIENIITDPISGVKTRSQLKNPCAFDAFLSLIEPENVVEALQDAD